MNDDASWKSAIIGAYYGLAVAKGYGYCASAAIEHCRDFDETIAFLKFLAQRAWIHRGRSGGRE